MVTCVSAGTLRAELTLPLWCFAVTHASQSSRFNAFFAFVLERHNIYLRRTAGKPKPWTADPLLQQYRFCNVYRELDKVTIWLREHWREPHAQDPDLWFAMVVARLINRPAALLEGGFPLPWKPSQWVRMLDARRARGEQVFSAAYMIRGVESNGRSKVQYLAEDVLTPMWVHRKAFPARGTLAAAHVWLMKFYGMGSFLAAQVVADVKYTPLLACATDWHTWAAPGPGSQRGLNRLLGRTTTAPWNAEEWLRYLRLIQSELNTRLPAKWEPFHAQDVQNCLCEFDKYTRAKNGEGRPKQRYVGGA